jgi:hypothetical protein
MVYGAQGAIGCWCAKKCAQAREALAYAAQDKWLAQFGSNVGKEFGLHAITILVRTKCMH